MGKEARNPFPILSGLSGYFSRWRPEKQIRLRAGVFDRLPWRHEFASKVG